MDLTYEANYYGLKEQFAGCCGEVCYFVWHPKQPLSAGSLEIGCLGYMPMHALRQLTQSNLMRINVSVSETAKEPSEVRDAPHVLAMSGATPKSVDARWSMHCMVNRHGARASASIGAIAALQHVGWSTRRNLFGKVLCFLAVALRLSKQWLASFGLEDGSTSSRRQVMGRLTHWC